jgi:hypothetical protein
MEGVSLLPCISDPPEFERASSFWRGTRPLRIYLIGSLCVVVWYRVYMVVSPAVASWWHVRSAFQTMSHWWK